MATKRVPSVDDLTAPDARVILKRLWDKGGKLREEIRSEIEAFLGEVVPEDVSDAVLTELDGIAVEDLWDRSGARSGGGYTDPDDETWEMIHDTLAPFIGELDRYVRLRMHNEALSYCVGLLEGIYLFGTKSKTEFRTWAEDDPREAFEWTLDRWKNASPPERLLQRMADELATRCPEWPASR